MPSPTPGLPTTDAKDHPKMSAAALQPAPAPAPGPPPSAAPVPGVDVPRPWLAQVLYDTVGRRGARAGLVWIAVVAFFAAFAPFIANSHPYLLKTTDPMLVSKYGGPWSSPLFQHLGPADVALPILAFTAVILWFNRKLRPGQKLALFAVVTLAVLPMVLWKPFQIEVRGRIRQWPDASAKGRLIWFFIWSHFLIALDVGLLLWIIVKSPIPRRALTFCLLALAPLALALVIWPVNPPLTAVYQEYREAQAAGHVQFILRAPLPYSPSDRLRDQFDLDRPHPRAPSRDHWLGTESNGSDILSSMIHACRIAMAIGFIATGIAVVIGSILGGLMGYFVGWVDLLGMRVLEIFNGVPPL